MSSKKLLQQTFGLTLVVLLLVGCGGAPAEPVATPTSVPPTPTPVPPTPTPINIEPLLIQPGDLPSSYKLGEITSPPKWISNNMPEADEEIYAPLEKDGEFHGAVAIYSYGTNHETAKAYGVILTGMGEYRIGTNTGEYPEIISDIGEKSACAVVWDPVGNSAGSYGADFSFERCNSVVRIRYIDTLSQGEVLDNIVAYAKKLDARIREVVCNK